MTRTAPVPGLSLVTTPGPGPVLAALSVGPRAVFEEELAERARGLAFRAALVGAGFEGGAAHLEAQTEPDPVRVRDVAAFLEAEAGRVLLLPGPPVPAAWVRALAGATPWLAGVPDGDPSPATARGVAVAVRAARPDLAGASAVVMGLGRVGRRVAERLAEEGAAVRVAETDDEVAGSWPRISPEAALTEACDLLSPNTRGMRLDPAGAVRVRARLLAGSDPVAEDDDVADVLAARGVTALPEALTGSGWLLALAAERFPDRGDPFRRLGSRVRAVLDRSREDGTSPRRAARAVVADEGSAP